MQGDEQQRKSLPEIQCPHTGMQQCEEEKKERSGSLGLIRDLKGYLKSVESVKRETSMKKKKEVQAALSP